MTPWHHPVPPTTPADIARALQAVPRAVFDLPAPDRLLGVASDGWDGPGVGKEKETDQ